MKETVSRDRSEYQHNYYVMHKKKLKEANHKRYVANIEERRAKALAYYHKHRDDINRRRKELRNVGKNNSHNLLQKPSGSM